MTSAAKALYAPAYMRKLFASIVSNRVVCTTLSFKSRNKTAFDDVAIVTVNFATQSYRIPRQRKSGSAGLGTVTFIDGLRADSAPCHYIASIGYLYEVFNFRVYVVTGLSSHGEWYFEGIPNGDTIDLSKALIIGTRSGFFVKSVTDRANIFAECWVISSNPFEAVTGSEWVSQPYMFDTWAWTHFMHLLFGINLLLSLGVLVLVSYRNFVLKKLWIDDAFAAVSSRTTLRGVMLLVPWYVSGFWSLLKFCVFNGNEISKVTTMEFYGWIIYTDLFTLYFFV
uniref:Uncharacterized protein n=1 Tax=Globisporangium ultimum (strain ATCC 200006 / CBS 805.95 / DAOM BR144) TaxID=431595 RepID=K3X336_GLOUD